MLAALKFSAQIGGARCPGGNGGRGAQRSALKTEVTMGARILSAPRFFQGTHGKHEAFQVQCDDGSNLEGQRLEVIDNVDIAPEIGVHPGDQVEVRGELIRDPDETIIHWTHHDPQGHHPDGYIKLNGKLYA